MDNSVQKSSRKENLVLDRKYSCLATLYTRAMILPWNERFSQLLKKYTFSSDLGPKSIVFMVASVGLIISVSVEIHYTEPLQ